MARRSPWPDPTVVYDLADLVIRSTTPTGSGALERVNETWYDAPRWQQTTERLRYRRDRVGD